MKYISQICSLPMRLDCFDEMLFFNVTFICVRNMKKYWSRIGFPGARRGTLIFQFLQSSAVYIMRFLALFGVLICLSSTGALSAKFFTGFNGGNCTGCEWVQLDGPIEKGDAQRFKQFVDTNGITPFRQHNILYLNSPGGNLAEGIKLGRLLRELGFTTAIGRTVPLDGGLGSGSLEFKDASCISACAYAFLGGKFRALEFSDEEVCLGFHQFYNPTLANGGDNSVSVAQTSTQKISGIVIEYLNEIDSDARIYSFASQFVGAEVGCISQEESKVFRIDNTEEYFEDVELLPFSKGLVAEVKAPLRDRKVRIYCTRNSTHLAFFASSGFLLGPIDENFIRLEVQTTGNSIPVRINTNIMTKDKKYSILVVDISRSFAREAMKQGRLQIGGDYPRVMSWISDEFTFNLPGDPRIVDFALDNCVG